MRRRKDERLVVEDIFEEGGQRPVRRPMGAVGPLSPVRRRLPAGRLAVVALAVIGLLAGVAALAAYLADRGGGPDRRQAPAPAPQRFALPQRPVAGPPPPSPAGPEGPAAATTPAKEEAAIAAPPSLGAAGEAAAADGPAPGAEGPGDAVYRLSSLIGKGAFAEAAAIFHRRVSEQGVGFAIRLKVDCLARSLHTAFRQASYARKLFILPKALDGQDCYVVFWGAYPTAADALASLDSVPPFFTRLPGSLPSVVPLADYL